MADTSGAPLARAPPTAKIFLISCSFWENPANLYVGAPPPRGWRPLLRGILYPSLHSVSQFTSHSFWWLIEEPYWFKARFLLNMLRILTHARLDGTLLLPKFTQGEINPHKVILSNQSEILLSMNVPVSYLNVFT